jgi:hypothetical protein
MADSSIDIPDSQKIKVLVERLRGVQKGLKSDLAKLHTDLAALDSEPIVPRLGDAQKDAETRAKQLEREVKELREELKTFREFLGANGEKKSPAD